MERKKFKYVSYQKAELAPLYNGDVPQEYRLTDITLKPPTVKKDKSLLGRLESNKEKVAAQKTVNKDKPQKRREPEVT